MNTQNITKEKKRKSYLKKEKPAYKAPVKFELYKSDSPVVLSYDDAVKWTSSLKGGWRLPTVYELTTLYDHSLYNGKFKTSLYWTSDEYIDEMKDAIDTRLGWVKGFRLGLEYVKWKDHTFHVRPVRGTISTIYTSMLIRREDKD